VPFKHLKGFSLTVSFVIVLATGEIAVMEMAVGVHDLYPFQVEFEQLDIAPEKRLKIFVLAKAQVGVVWS
jgi:hypothetical protein